MMMKRIFSYTSWSVADQLVRLGVGMIVSVALARYLGPHQFGLYSIVLATVAIASCLVPLAADAIVTRELVMRPEATPTILGSQALLRLIGTCTAAAASTIAIMALHPDIEHLWIVALVASAGLLLQPFDAIGVWLNAKLLAKANVAARLPGFLLMSASRLVAIALQLNLVAFIVLVPVEAGLIALGYVLTYRYLGQNVMSWRATKAELATLFRDSWPLLISGISSLLYLRLDVLMLGAMAGEFEVGIYSAATRIAEAWYFIPTIIAAAVQPLILQLKRDDAAGYSLRLGQLYASMAWLSVSVGILVSFTASAIISLLFGPAYASAAPVLIVHVWAGVPVFLGVASSQFLIAENLTRISMYRTGLGLLANVSLNLVLIPRLGALGAAIATVISYMIATFSLLLFSKSRDQVWKMIAGFAPSAALDVVATLQRMLFKNVGYRLG